MAKQGREYAKHRTAKTAAKCRMCRNIAKAVTDSGYSAAYLEERGVRLLELVMVDRMHRTHYAFNRVVIYYAMRDGMFQGTVSHKHRSQQTAAKCLTCKAILKAFADANIAPGQGVYLDIDTQAQSLLTARQFAHFEANFHNIMSAHFAWQTRNRPIRTPKPATKSLAAIFAQGGVSQADLLALTAGEAIVKPESVKRQASGAMIESLVRKARAAYEARNDKLAEHLLKEASRRQRAIAA